MNIQSKDKLRYIRNNVFDKQKYFNFKNYLYKNIYYSYNV